ncbi:uncharacterized protein [Notamacropus eugenii]|uniref:uncharacterized protein n=1 Tax=Notamacropus eugenii TaxID=9315 RepID=UPI003B677202
MKVFEEAASCGGEVCWLQSRGLNPNSIVTYCPRGFGRILSGLSFLICKVTEVGPDGLEAQPGEERDLAAPRAALQHAARRLERLLVRVRRDGPEEQLEPPRAERAAGVRAMEQEKERAPHEGRAVKEKEWYPTHVQLTILRAQNLQAKGRSGFSNAYVIMRLQKQKYMTSVVRHNLNPEWKEDCILRLPGKLDILEDPNLILTVKHHSQWFADQFLGQISISLKQLFQDKTKRNNEWFILQSKSRKANKYLGRLQLSIQFMEISGQDRESVFPRDSGSWSSFGKFHSRLMSKRSKIYKANPFPMPSIGDYSYINESERASIIAPSSSGYTFPTRGCRNGAMI